MPEEKTEKMFRLTLITGMAHPPFKFEKLGEAMAAAQNALEKGYFRHDEEDSSKKGEMNTLIHQLGPGSQMHVASEERLLEHVKRQQEEQGRLQRMAQGLITSPPEHEELPCQLVVTTHAGQIVLGFASKAEAISEVEQGIKRGWLHHSEREEDHVYLQMGPGTLYMILSKENFEMQKRRAIEEAMRKAQQQRQMQQGKPLVIPGGKN